MQIIFKKLPISRISGEGGLNSRARGHLFQFSAPESLKLLPQPRELRRSIYESPRAGFMYKIQEKHITFTS